MVYSLFQLASTGNWRASTVPSRGLGGHKGGRRAGSECQGRAQLGVAAATADEPWHAACTLPRQLAQLRMRGWVPLALRPSARRGKH